MGRVVGCKSIIHVRIQEENPPIFFIRVESNRVSQHLRRSLSASSASDLMGDVFGMHLFSFPRWIPVKQQGFFAECF